MAGTCKNNPCFSKLLYNLFLPQKNRAPRFFVPRCVKKTPQKMFQEMLKNIKKRLIPKSHCKKTVDQNLSIMKVLLLRFSS